MARRRSSTFEKVGLSFVAVWILGIIGYVMNAWKCVVGILDAPTIGEVSTVAWVQLLGVFTGPIGSVMGWVIW